MTDPDLSDVTERELLIDMNRQLAAIRALLQGDETEREAQYECSMCREVVSGEDREKHLEDAHNAFVDAINIDQEFEEIKP